LNKEIFLLQSIHGAAGDGDDRQGNGLVAETQRVFFVSAIKGSSQNLFQNAL
jgi:hypothetical protein